MHSFNWEPSPHPPHVYTDVIHVTKWTRSSSFVFAYCKWSKTGRWEGLAMRLSNIREVSLLMRDSHRYCIATLIQSSQLIFAYEIYTHYIQTMKNSEQKMHSSWDCIIHTPTFSTSLGRSALFSLLAKDSVAHTVHQIPHAPGIAPMEFITPKRAPA